MHVRLCSVSVLKVSWGHAHTPAIASALSLSLYCCCASHIGHIRPLPRPRAGKEAGGPAPPSCMREWAKIAGPQLAHAWAAAISRSASRTLSPRRCAHTLWYGALAITLRRMATSRWFPAVARPARLSSHGGERAPPPHRRPDLPGVTRVEVFSRSRASEVRPTSRL